MDNDEQVFDFLAAAEDTGKQLDGLIEAIPGEVRAALAAEYRQSPWLAELPKAADSVTAAAERAEAAAATLTRKAKAAGALVCLAAVIVPLSTWGYAYRQTASLRREREALRKEAGELREAIGVMRGETGGGARLARNDGGEYVFTLPPGLVFTDVRPGMNSISYTPPE